MARKKKAYSSPAGNKATQKSSKKKSKGSKKRSSTCWRVTKSLWKLYAVYWVVFVMLKLAPNEGFSWRRYFDELFFWSVIGTCGVVKFVGDPVPCYKYIHAYMESRPDPHFSVPKIWEYDAKTFTFEQAWEDHKMEAPILIRGFAKDLVDHITWEYVTENFEDNEVNINTPRIGINDTWSLNYDYDSSVVNKMNLQEGLKRMARGEALYMRFEEDLAKSQPLLEDVLSKVSDRLNLSDSTVAPTRFCFLNHQVEGGAPMVTHLHNGATDNWFVQISGHKHWGIHHPGIIPWTKMYFTRTVAFVSELPMMRFGSIPPLKVTTYAGDALLFPSMWPHEVTHDNGFNFGCGLRPRAEMLERYARALFTPHRVYPERGMGNYLTMIPNFLHQVKKAAAARSFSGKHHNTEFFGNKQKFEEKVMKDAKDADEKSDL